MFHYFFSENISQLTALISVRTLLSVLTSFIITLLLVPIVIRNIQRRKVGQNIRELGPKTHYQKAGKPTMGGIAMVTAIFVTSLIWCKLNELVVLAIISTVWLGMVGFIDDILKFIRQSSDGLSAKSKMFLILILGITLGIFIYKNKILSSTLFVPVINKEFDISWWYVLFIVFIIASWSNAVNLTDGLDGLAIGIVILVAFALGGIAYVTGNAIFSKHLGLPFIRGAGELSVFCASILGAGLGFYWYNAAPAEIFMGDVGSLALGGAIGVVSIFTKSELILALIGGIFVIEALSVMIQVFSYKYFKKRVFKMSPIHHHFELSGWPETKVVARFWVITFILILIGLCVIGLNTILVSKII